MHPTSLPLSRSTNITDFEGVDDTNGYFEHNVILHLVAINIPRVPTDFGSFDQLG